MARSIGSLATGSLATQTATLRLTAGDLRIVHEATVPADEVPATQVVPALQSLVNTVVDDAERKSIASGAAISCRKGCGACCRQLVPISRTEGERLNDLLDSMPTGRRMRLKKRFEEAADRVERAGLASANGRSDREMSLAYWALRIPCPFLEEESCSIHPERPLVCREYLVTSPAELCSGPAQEGVTPVAVPKFSLAARKLQDETDDWLPLTLLYRFRRKHRAGGGRPDDRRAGMAWLQGFIRNLGKSP